ncbi:hypothetical protein GLOIN_2v1575118, partial [Rhizophagus irregularis DAOM 181602=DAOM 197198]
NTIQLFKKIFSNFFSTRFIIIIIIIIIIIYIFNRRTRESEISGMSISIFSILCNSCTIINCSGCSDKCI